MFTVCVQAHPEEIHWNFSFCISFLHFIWIPPDEWLSHTQYIHSKYIRQHLACCPLQQAVLSLKERRLVETEKREQMWERERESQEYNGAAIVGEAEKKGGWMDSRKPKWRQQIECLKTLLFERLIGLHPFNLHSGSSYLFAAAPFCSTSSLHLGLPPNPLNSLLSHPFSRNKRCLEFTGLDLCIGCSCIRV